MNSFPLQPRNTSQRIYPPSLPIVNHLEQCSNFLAAQGYPNTELIASFASYMTGLQYHPNAEKPQNQGIYRCFPEKNNQHDPNALGVYSQSGRMAFVPKDLSNHIATNFMHGSAFTMVCYATSKPTEKSCQAIYNVFLIHPSAPLVASAPPDDVHIDMIL